MSRPVSPGRLEAIGEPTVGHRFEPAQGQGPDKIMSCGYLPAGLTLERQLQDMPNVPFKDDVWPKFLRENALRVFKIPEAIERATGKPFVG